MSRPSGRRSSRGIFLRTAALSPPPRQRGGHATPHGRPPPRGAPAHPALIDAMNAVFSGSSYLHDACTRVTSHAAGRIRDTHMRTYARSGPSFTVKPLLKNVTLASAVPASPLHERAPIVNARGERRPVAAAAATSAWTRTWKWRPAQKCPARRGARQAYPRPRGRCAAPRAAGRDPHHTTIAHAAHLPRPSPAPPAYTLLAFSLSFLPSPPAPSSSSSSFARIDASVAIFGGIAAPDAAQAAKVRRRFVASSNATRECVHE